VLFVKVHPRDAYRELLFIFISQHTAHCVPQEHRVTIRDMGGSTYGMDTDVPRHFAETGVFADGLVEGFVRVGFERDGDLLDM